MSKMKEGSINYNREAIEIALSKVTIKPCIRCGHPVDDGFCCDNCYSGVGTGNADESHINYKAISTT